MNVSRFYIGLIFLFFSLLVSSCDSSKSKNNQQLEGVDPAAVQKAMEENRVPILNAFEDDSEYFKDQDPSLLFRILPPGESGITFNNPFIETFEYNLWAFDYSLIGGGVAVGDVNQDGLPDLYFSGNTSPNKLYLNKGGLKFEDISQSAGVDESEGMCAGVSMVDLNEDGWLDIYVSRAGNFPGELRQNLLYINNQDLTFTEKAAEYGLNDSAYTVQTNFLDYDLDGDLDAYVSNHPTDFRDKFKPTGYDKVEKGINFSDHFYRNNGDGTFTDISLEAGINNHGYGLGPTVGDLNQDGWPDLYVCNDFAMNDHIYLNNRQGGFTEKVKGITRKIGQNTMGVDIDDLNNDGFVDMAASDLKMDNYYQQKTFRENNKTADYYQRLTQSGFHYQYPHNTLQLNNGDGTYSEIAEFAGTAATNWSWGPLMVDLDNDGWKDLFVPNGFYIEVHTDQTANFVQLGKSVRKGDKKSYFEYRMQMPRRHLKYPNFFFRNLGDLTFSDMSSTWSAPIPTCSYGATYADLDGDGDLEVITNNTNQVATIYENQSENLLKHHFLKVKLKSEQANRFGWGSLVWVEDPSGAVQMRQMNPIKGYQSSAEPVLHFGLGKQTCISKVYVRWPDGKTDTIFNIEPDQTLTFHQEEAKIPPPSLFSPSQKLFTDITKETGIAHFHQESAFEDWDREFLIHRKLSRNGPGIAVADVNADGLDDFYVGGAAGYPGSLYIQQVDGTFRISEKNRECFLFDQNFEDMGTAFFDYDSDGDLDLFVASGSNELEPENEFYRDRIYTNDGNGNFEKDLHAIYYEILVSSSCVIPIDFDRDGDLDLFLGGRVSPAAYPNAPRSYLLEYKDHRFMDVTASRAPELLSPGMVTSALWSDYDNDGDPDLILTGEWMSPKIFQNSEGHFKEVTTSLGLDNLTGWWNSISAGDFDLDGDMDYVLGNVGRNMSYKTSEKEPVELFYADFDQNGEMEMVLSYWDRGNRYPWHIFDRMVEKMPFLDREYPNYHDFGMATLEDMLDSRSLRKALRLEAKTFGHVVLLNQSGTGFEVRDLPPLAQISPLMGMIVNDFNGDGLPDVLAHGNFYGFEAKTDRQDAGTGILLLGDGKGNFTGQRSLETGFKSASDARSLALVKRGPEIPPLVLAASSNDSLRAFTWNISPKNWIAPRPEEVSFFIQHPDGRKMKIENYSESGYLSSFPKYWPLFNVHSKVTQ